MDQVAYLLDANIITALVSRDKQITLSTAKVGAAVEECGEQGITLPPRH